MATLQQLIKYGLIIPSIIFIYSRMIKFARHLIYNDKET